MYPVCQCALQKFVFFFIQQTFYFHQGFSIHEEYVIMQSRIIDGFMNSVLITNYYLLDKFGVSFIMVDVNFSSSVEW